MVSGGFFLWPSFLLFPEPCILDVEQGGLVWTVVLKKEYIQVLQLKWLPPFWLCFSHFTHGNMWGLGFHKGSSRKRPVVTSFCFRVLCEGFLHVCNTHTLSVYPRRIWRNKGIRICIGGTVHWIWEGLPTVWTNHGETPVPNDAGFWFCGQRLQNEGQKCAISCTCNEAVEGTRQ